MTDDEKLIENVRSAKVALRRAEIEQDYAFKLGEAAKARFERVKTEVLIAEDALMASTLPATV